jgi:DivIVA domain-containing protein
VNLVAVLVVLAVVGVVAAVVVGAVHGGLEEPTSTLPPSGLPEGDLVPEDLEAVRFSLGFRGYRMDEVDEVLQRVTADLARRDAELAELRSRLQERPEPRPEGPRRAEPRPTEGEGPGEPTAQSTTEPTAQSAAQPTAQSAVQPNGQPNAQPNGATHPAASPQRT